MLAVEEVYCKSLTDFFWQDGTYYFFLSQKKKIKKNKNIPNDLKIKTEIWKKKIAKKV